MNSTQHRGVVTVVNHPKYLQIVAAPRFSHVIDRHFQDGTDCDFRIVCGSRTFHVHRVVLKACSYFMRLLGCDVKETREGMFNAVEDDPDLIEAMLCLIYGAPVAESVNVVIQGIKVPVEEAWILVSKSAKGVVESLPEDIHKPFAKTTWIEYIFATSCHSLRDPTPYEAKVACLVSMRLLRFHVLLDKYQLQIPDILRAGFSVVPDAWFHQDVLEVTQVVYEELHAGGSFEAVFVALFSNWIISRLDLLMAEPEFRALLERSPTLTRNVLYATQTVVCPSLLTHGLAYCANSACRRNVPYCSKTKNMQVTEDTLSSTVMCFLCKNQETIAPRKIRQWMYKQEAQT